MLVLKAKDTLHSWEYKIAIGPEIATCTSQQCIFSLDRLRNDITYLWDAFLAFFPCLINYMNSNLCCEVANKEAA